MVVQQQEQFLLMKQQGMHTYSLMQSVSLVKFIAVGGCDSQKV